MKLHGWKIAGKSWAALAGSLLTALIPWFVTTIAPTLPEPWPMVITAIVAIMTAVGVYHAPYQPAPNSRNATPDSLGPSPWPTS